MELLLLIVLIILLIAALPTWPYSAKWGYSPVGIIAIILLVYLILALTGTVALFPPPR